MPKNDTDKLFETLFGYNPSGDTEEEAPKPLPAAPPIPDDPETLARAAEAVRDAVLAHKGRRPAADRWKPVAAKVLGVSRLYQKRWDAVLARGAELGILREDKESLSYPVLEVTTPPEPEEPEPEVAVVPTRPPPEPYKPPPLPENWNPPKMMDCGHLSFREQTEINEEGVETTFCEGCRKKYPPSWRDLKGEFVRPLPKYHHRTEEKARGGGFPGYCCDDEGYYIGGITNNCRYANPKDKTKWCAYHRSVGKLVGD